MPNLARPIDVTPPATSEELAAIIAVLATTSGDAAADAEREPAWRIAARREATGALS